jgi:hypothetical protein
LAPSVLYVGDDSPATTSLHRAQALERIGCRVVTINPAAYVPSGRLLTPLHYRTGFGLVRRRVARAVLAEVGDRKFDVAWVNGGMQVGPDLVRKLHDFAGVVVNYNNDDPTGGRDGRAWNSYLAALPEYDLVVVVRDPNVGEVGSRGARAVHRVFMSYDNVAHAPRTLTPEDESRWRSEVLFVGTWMPERGPFLSRLVEAGIPLTIIGSRWQHAPEWPQLKAYWRGDHINGDDYAMAIQCAKVCLGLLSKGNRDEHTQRSLEVPALGGLLCGERTPEHQALYQDGVEAVLWDDADECAEVCAGLLADEPRRRAIAAAGHTRALRLKLSNEDVVADILQQVGIVAKAP